MLSSLLLNPDFWLRFKGREVIPLGLKLPGVTHLPPGPPELGAKTNEILSNCVNPSYSKISATSLWPTFCVSQW